MIDGSGRGRNVEIAPDLSQQLVAIHHALVPLFYDYDYRIAGSRVRRLELLGRAPWVNYTRIEAARETKRPGARARESVRIAANTPPLCTGEVSPGVDNSWPKWSPLVETKNGKQYYWLTFSSTRSLNGKPQLYVSAITVEGDVITTYPALYLWNQPANESNHTPAWDDFQIVID